MKFTSKTYDKILILLGAIALIWVGFQILTYRDIKKEILNNHSFTIGEIVDYSVVGDIRTHYLSYKYYVDSVEYINRTVNPKKEYKNCAEYIGSCKSFRFWVMYSNIDPANSLIDVTNDISEDSIRLTPTDFINFQ